MKKQYTDDELSRIQVEKEIAMKTAGMVRFGVNNDRAISEGVASDTQWNRRIIQELVGPMSEAIDIYLEYYNGRAGKPAKAVTYLRSLSSKQSAYITIKNILDSLTRETEAITVARTIGARIEDQVRFSGISAAAPRYIEKVKNALKKNNTISYKHKTGVLSHANDVLVKGNYEREIEPKPELRWNVWPDRDLCLLGSHLITLFAENVLFEGKPVIYKRSVIDGKNNKTYITPTGHIDKWVAKYKKVMEVMSPAFAPCVVPPRDWVSPTEGGYHIQEISNTLPFIKCKKSQLKRLTLKQMPVVYKAANILQRVPWQVNEETFSIAEEVLRLGLPLAVPATEPLELPESPVHPAYELLRGEALKRCMTAREWAEFLQWKRDTSRVHTKENERKADIVKIARMMGSAKQYKDFEKIYFVYTLDFRGRIYSKSDSVSPQGADIQKGLIRLANGKALSKDGMYWLAVHGSSVLGKDKGTFDERVAWMRELDEGIRDIAADPLTFTDWAAADKPWQYLAWCCEWARLLDHIDNGKEAKTFVSHIKCAQDGSCSGIQHYSAILRDPIGGAAVNLVPDVRPHDIYGDVAEVTEREMGKLIDEGVAEAHKSFLADKEVVTRGVIAEGWVMIIGITRTLTKMPVMTLPYGSTQIRCLDTTSDYLEELQSKEDRAARAAGRPAAKIHPFAVTRGDEAPTRLEGEKLASSVIWKSIGEVVVAARTGMKFIQNVASFLAKAGYWMEVITPTGFIIEQREMDYESRRVKTQLLGETFMSLKEELTTYNPRKMRTSSAPNFIHGMDASHLVLAVNAANDEGITDIGVIHDDFGCHACDVPLLRDCIRNTFVDMYEENDVFTLFKEHNEFTHAINIEVDVPEKLGLDLQLVRKSAYFVS